MEREVGPDPEKSDKIPKGGIPKGTSKGNNGPSPKNLRTILGNKEKSPKLQKGGFDIRPDSGERDREREELLRTVKIITKANGDTSARQNASDLISYLNKENTNSKIQWDRRDSFEGSIV